MKDNLLLKRLAFFPRIPGTKDLLPLDGAPENGPAGMTPLSPPARLRSDELFMHAPYLWRHAGGCRFTAKP